MAMIDAVPVPTKCGMCGQPFKPGEYAYEVTTDDGTKHLSHGHGRGGIDCLGKWEIKRADKTGWLKKLGILFVPPPFIYVYTVESQEEISDTLILIRGVIRVERKTKEQTTK